MHEVILKGIVPEEVGQGQKVTNQLLTNQHSNALKLLLTINLRAIPPKSMMLSSKITSRFAENHYKKPVLALECLISR